MTVDSTETYKEFETNAVLYARCMRAMQRARAKMLREQPFYGIEAMNLELIPGTEHMGRVTDTAATDGRVLVANPEWFLGLSDEDQVTVLMHEVMHVVLLHHLRRGTRDPEYWNIAGDHAINTLINDHSGRSLEGWLCDKKYRNWPTEQIYRDVIPDDSPQPQPDQPGRGQPGDEADQPGGRSDEPEACAHCGRGEDACVCMDGPEKEPEGNDPVNVDQPSEPEPVEPEPGETKPEKPAGEVWDAVKEDGSEYTETEKREQESKKKEQITTARTAHDAMVKYSGTGGDSFGQAIDSVVTESAGWEDLLREFWTSKAAGDPLGTWRKLDRRAYNAGIISPYQEQVGATHVVLGFDKSGSVTSRERKAIFAQLQMLRDEAPAERISIVPFNHKVLDKEVIELADGDEFPETLPRGGGTTFASVMRWVDDLEDVPDVVIMLTDMEDWEYGKEPDCPVLWVSTAFAYDEPPFGEVIVIDVP
jgi:predicted metal-dependent peptidase